ncbi:MAG: MFS transporter [Oceanicaulis sp.]|uniref:MFS transporter n=1 Tax=Glycocaulis sp. TaxID=1969725 RepID=UPI0025B7C17E|nr:MFS transporter [Glycocaulis sp.]MCC5982251.1 MFS transporter [Oceanicaulis sp.]MCH8521332.1 MFS transporter [Glycocaulis sp.]
MSPARLFARTDSRFALFYGAFYFGFGAYLPYMPVWYAERGLSPELIGLAAAAGMIGRVLIAPLGAFWSDRATRRRDAILAFSAACLLVFLLHVPATDPVFILVLAGLSGAAVTGIVPLVDAFAMGSARRDGFAFGIPRAIGSGLFIVGNLGAGALISWLGGEAVLGWVLAGAVLTFAAAALLPEGRIAEAAREASEPSEAPRLTLLLAGGLPLAFAASALIQGAHGFYYAFSALAWRADGVPAWAIGLLWSTGVGAEIIFFAVWSRLLRGWSAASMMALGGAVAVVRWIALSLSPPLWLLFPLQTLHAFSFAASYLGFLRFASERAPERLAATAQAINSALSGGLVLAGATFASGVAFAAFGSGGFAIMAIPAGLGMICALLLVRRG